MIISAKWNIFLNSAVKSKKDKELLSKYSWRDGQTVKGFWKERSIPTVCLIWVMIFLTKIMFEERIICSTRREIFRNKLNFYNFTLIFSIMVQVLMKAK